MSNGPIEFLGEEFREVLPATEYGGIEGLIQGDSGLLSAADGMPIRHDLTAGEIRGIMTRAAGVPVDINDRNQKEMEALLSLEVRDPHTGRALDPDDKNKDVTGKSGREQGLADGMIE
jgi:hypothetical protein